MKALSYLWWVPRLVLSIVLLQTLFFKFSAAEESVYIFTTVGMEPWGRIGSGLVEGVAGILILLNARAQVLASILALDTMSGAIVSHLTILGIEVMGDGGELFYLAWAVAISALLVLYKNKTTMQMLIKSLKPAAPAAQA
jgi:hypothetical protein